MKKRKYKWTVEGDEKEIRAEIRVDNEVLAQASDELQKAVDQFLGREASKVVDVIKGFVRGLSDGKSEASKLMSKEIIEDSEP